MKVIDAWAQYPAERFLAQPFPELTRAYPDLFAGVASADPRNPVAAVRNPPWRHPSGHELGERP